MGRGIGEGSGAVRILSYSFETVTRMSEPVSMHDFVLRCSPLSSATQTVLDAQTVLAPECTLARQRDGFGNLLQVGRIVEPHDSFSFLSSGLVMADQAHERTCPADPVYRMPSHLAAASEGMRAFAASVPASTGAATDAAAGGGRPVLDRAVALAHAVFARMSYEPGATSVSTTAAQAFERGAGVCQDYAHILIALLRAEGVAARYVNGFMEGEGATHAWVEVHDGERWHGVDVTNDRVVDDGYIVLSRGRDFSDCPIEAGVFRGGAAQEQEVSVIVTEQGAQGRESERPRLI